MFPKRSGDNVYPVDTIAQNLCRTADFQTCENSVNLTVLFSCNSKGLILDFYLNRKRNKCLLAAYSCQPIYTSVRYRS